MNISPETLRAAQDRRDAMIAAVRSRDVSELARLSLHADHPFEFARGGRYHVATYGPPAAEFGAMMKRVATVDELTREYVALLEACSIIEFTGYYHGRERFGVGKSHVFHLEGGSISVCTESDILAVERLDADA